MPTLDKTSACAHGVQSSSFHCLWTTALACAESALIFPPGAALLLLDLLHQPSQSHKAIPCHKFQYMVLLVLFHCTLTDTLAIKCIV